MHPRLQANGLRTTNRGHPVLAQENPPKMCPHPKKRADAPQPPAPIRQGAEHAAVRKLAMVLGERGRRRCAFLIRDRVGIHHSTLVSRGVFRLGPGGPPPLSTGHRGEGHLRST